MKMHRRCFATKRLHNEELQLADRMLGRSLFNLQFHMTHPPKQHRDEMSDCTILLHRDHFRHHPTLSVMIRPSILMEASAFVLGSRIIVLILGSIKDVCL